MNLPFFKYFETNCTSLNNCFKSLYQKKNSSQVRSNIILYSQQSILAFQITYLPLERQIISHPLSQLLISNNWHLRTVSYSSEITLSFSFLEKKEKTGKKEHKELGFQNYAEFLWLLSMNVPVTCRYLKTIASSIEPHVMAGTN